MRLHNALRRNGLDSYFYSIACEPSDPSYVPTFQNRSFFWRNVAVRATSWRSWQEAPGGFVGSAR